MLQIQIQFDELLKVIDQLTDEQKRVLKERNEVRFLKPEPNRQKSVWQDWAREVFG